MTSKTVEIKQALHFIQFLLAFSEPITFAMYPAEEQLRFINYIWSDREDAQLGAQVLESLPGFWQTFVMFHLHGALFSLQFGIYCFLVLHQIRKHNVRLERHFSFTEQMSLKWLRTLTLLCALFLFLYLTLNRARIVLLGRFDITELGPNTPFLFLVLCIYVIGIAALRQPSIIRGVSDAAHDDHASQSSPDKEAGGRDDEIIRSVANSSVSSEKALHPKYERSGISQEDAQRYKERILRTMDEKKSYLDCDLTLRDLAAQVGISYHQASQVINRQMNQRFFSFVNDYRVQLAKNMMADPATRNMPIVELAIEVGFKSKSSFYDAFKKVTQMTPTQFKDSLEKPA